MRDLSDSALAEMLMSRCNLSLREIVAFLAARDEVRAIPEGLPFRATVPSSAGQTLRIGECYVDAVHEAVTDWSELALEAAGQ
jgi:hypothetical protein